jgi:L-fuculokinase
MAPVIAIFDIGKTNKKFFLFDEQYKIVVEKTQTFAEIVDDDGHACENVQELTAWVISTLSSVIKENKFSIKALNLSTYGASFVYINKDQSITLPLYNYLKSYPAALQQKFMKLMDLLPI